MNPFALSTLCLGLAWGTALSVLGAQPSWGGVGRCDFGSVAHDLDAARMEVLQRLAAIPGRKVTMYRWDGTAVTGYVSRYPEGAVHLNGGKIYLGSSDNPSHAQMWNAVGPEEINPSLIHAGDPIPGLNNLHPGNVTKFVSKRGNTYVGRVIGFTAEGKIQVEGPFGEGGLHTVGDFDPAFLRSINDVLLDPHERNPFVNPQPQKPVEPVNWPNARVVPKWPKVPGDPTVVPEVVSKLRGAGQQRVNIYSQRGNLYSGYVATFPDGTPQIIDGQILLQTKPGPAQIGGHVQFLDASQLNPKTIYYGEEPMKGLDQMTPFTLFELKGKNGHIHHGRIVEISPDRQSVTVIEPNGKRTTFGMVGIAENGIRAVGEAPGSAEARAEAAARAQAAEADYKARAASGERPAQGGASRRRQWPNREGSPGEQHAAFQNIFEAARYLDPTQPLVAYDFSGAQHLVYVARESNGAVMKNIDGSPVLTYAPLKGPGSRIVQINPRQFDPGRIHAGGPIEGLEHMNPYTIYSITLLNGKSYRGTISHISPDGHGITLLDATTGQWQVIARSTIARRGIRAEGEAPGAEQDWKYAQERYGPANGGRGDNGGYGGAQADARPQAKQAPPAQDWQAQQRAWQEQEAARRAAEAEAGAKRAQAEREAAAKKRQDEIDQKRAAAENAEKERVEKDRKQKEFLEKNKEKIAAARKRALDDGIDYTHLQGRSEWLQSPVGQEAKQQAARAHPNDDVAYKHAQGELWARMIFKRLGVPLTADNAARKARFRKLSLYMHSDHNPDPEAAEAYKIITEAYSFIK